MKIIFINQVTGPLLIDIINVFLKNNIEVVLYTGKIEKTYSSLNNKIYVRFLKSYNRSSPLLRIYTWLVFFIQTIFYLFIDLKKETKIYLSSNPPIFPFINLLFKNQSVIHIYDVYPDALLASKMFTQKSLIYKIFSFFNKKSFQKSLQIYTPSNGMKEMLSNYIQKKKITVVNWWSDSEFIKPIPKKENKFLKTIDLQDKFIILYSGNFGFSHNIEKILSTALLFKNENQIAFILIGNGPKKNIVDNFQKKNKLNNLHVLPFQNTKILPFSISCGDISIILDSFSINDKEKSTASIPSKTYYYLSAGSAIYAETDNTSELSQLINDNNIGIADSNKETTNFVNFINECINFQENLNIYKNNSRHLSKIHYKKMQKYIKIHY